MFNLFIYLLDCEFIFILQINLQETEEYLPTYSLKRIMNYYDHYAVCVHLKLFRAFLPSLEHLPEYSNCVISESYRYSILGSKIPSGVAHFHSHKHYLVSRSEINLLNDF